MTSSRSLLLIRLHSSLASKLPGLTATFPSLSAVVAPSGVSRRRPALRFLASKPWQAKQLSDKIGRISRLNASGPAAEAGPAAQSPTARYIGRRNRLGIGRLVCAPKVYARPPAEQPWNCVESRSGVSPLSLFEGEVISVPPGASRVRVQWEVRKILDCSSPLDLCKRRCNRLTPGFTRGHSGFSVPRQIPHNSPGIERMALA